MLNVVLRRMQVRRMQVRRVTVRHFLINFVIKARVDKGASI
jgi:hypothetical protein